MTYDENVQAMCDELGIVNPIREEDLAVKAVSFLVKGDWVRIEGTNMNRAGRLFFQKWSKKHHTKASVHTWNDDLENCLISMHALNVFATKHFAGHWKDAEKQGRKMLTAFKHAQAVTVHWK